MTTLSDFASKQLYIPDYGVWDSFYQRRAKPSVSASGSNQVESTKQNSEDKVNLKFVSPVSETISQAQSEMKKKDNGVKSFTLNFNRAKKKKKNKTSAAKEKKPKNVSSNQKKNGAGKRKKGLGGKNKFSYRALNDIFSKRK